MKKKVTTILTICLFCITISGNTVSLGDDTIRIPMGTTISLQLNEEVDASQVEVGRLIELKVRQDVIIKDKKVVFTGARAEGFVRVAIKPCQGYCGFHESLLVIEVDNVQTSDGQKLPLMGAPLCIKGDGVTHTPAVAKQFTLINGVSRTSINVKSISINP